MLLWLATISVLTGALVTTSPDEPSGVTTDCAQAIHFFLATEHSPVFWLGEDIDGECYGSWLRILSFESDQPHLASMATLDFAEWGWIESAQSSLHLAPVVELIERDGSWQAEGEEWMIGLPRERTDLLASFQDHLVSGGRGARPWTQVDADDRIVPPTFYGAGAELKYAYDRGLYVNYGIDAAYYFPSYGWLLVIIDQELLDIGKDTMHGFLIYRLRHES